MNILTIGAHPDDADIWCGGTLRKYSEQGHNVFIAVVANGNLGTNRYSQQEIVGIREAEQLEAAKLYNAQVKFLRYNDFELVDSVELRKSVLDAIRWANPDVILTHYPQDACDHGMTSEIVTRVLLYGNYSLIGTENPAISKMPSVFFYDTYAGIGFQPEVYVDITDQLKYKKEAYSKHVSQNEYNNTGAGWGEVLELLSSFRGLQSGHKYAEGFIGFKTYGFLPDYTLLP
ncbi:MAG: PIG-L family deacetylase [Eubacteriales bacterium]|nr:PIG-L family deacetylase [Eubacteriales bacterium]